MRTKFKLVVDVMVHGRFAARETHETVAASRQSAISNVKYNVRLSRNFAPTAKHCTINVVSCTS